MKGYYGNSVSPKRKPGADNFPTRKEMVEACYKARLTLHRKHATIEEMREAGLVLNKAVRTLHSWIGSIRLHAIDKAVDAHFASERKKAGTTGPLIPLNFK